MNILFVGRNHGKSKVLKLNNARLVLLGIALLSVVIGLIASGYMLREAFVEKTGGRQYLGQEVMDVWLSDLQAQKRELADLKQYSQEQIDALTLRLGNMQARLMRLDALGRRLTEVADINSGEFDFSSSPPVGGPIADEGESYKLPELLASLDHLDRQISDRENQLEVIDQLFVRRNIRKELFIAGRPISWGWMSSAYGYRTDPFNGRRAWHDGVDFAGKEDSEIIAVASGVVTFAGDRYGYGNLVEINHGGGFATRYGHCKELLVDVGAVVEKGQQIATMGSTGRSTGPHVHYEVLRHGKSIDPKKYILRASR